MFLQLGNIIACTVVFCHFVLCIVTYNNWSENSAKKCNCVAYSPSQNIWCFLDKIKYFLTTVFRLAVVGGAKN